MSDSKYSIGQRVLVINLTSKETPIFARIGTIAGKQIFEDSSVIYMVLLDCTNQTYEIVEEFLELPGELTELLYL